jgi:drug/metabolite transporter (DMT)-like permease
MKWIFLFGCIYMTPVGISDVLRTNWSCMTGQVWFAIAFVVVATTFLAYLLNTYALKALSSSVVSMYIYFQPFLATLFAVLLGKDTLTTIKVISAILIITGVYLVSYRRALPASDN